MHIWSNDVTWLLRFASRMKRAGLLPVCASGSLLAALGAGWVATRPEQGGSNPDDAARGVMTNDMIRNNLIKVNSLRLEATVLLREDYLERLDPTLPLPVILKDVGRKLLLSQSILPSKDAALEFDAFDLAFSDLCVAMRYKGMLSGSFLTGSSSEDDTAARGRHTAVDRLIRISALGWISLMQLRLMRLRQKIRFVMLKEHRELINRHFSPVAVEDMLNRAKRILDLPVHPWIAASESFTLPRPARTLWGLSVQSIGLDKGQVPDDACERALGTAEYYNNAVDPACQVDPVETLQTIRADIATVEDIIATLSANGVLADVMSALGYVSVGSPRAIALHGADLRPLYTNKIAFTDSVADLLDAAVRPHYPVDIYDPQRAAWIAPSSLAEKTLRQIFSGRTAPFITELAMSPAVPPMERDYLLERFPASKISYLDESYRGDPGLVVIQPDATQFLRSINLDPEVVKAGLAANGWGAQMATDSDGNLTWLELTRGKSYRPRYYSSITEDTWRRRLILPTNLAPRYLVGLRRGVPFATAEIGSRFITDEVIPEAVASADRVVDATLTIVEKAYR